MKGKGKQSEKQQVSELYSARNKFNEALNMVMVKIEESSDSSDDDSAKSSPEPVNKESAASASKRASSSGKITRKRRRKDDNFGKDGGSGQQTFIMKLFDRSVNLAKFNDKSTLYPVVRAWMENDPHNANPSRMRPKSSWSPIKSEPSTGEEEDGKPKDVLELPLPAALKYDSEGNAICVRVPESLPRTAEPLDINSEDFPNKKELLEENMLRWKEIRQRWKDAAFKNEERYKDSMDLIKTMFVR